MKLINAVIERIKYYLNKKQLTQYQLSKLSGVPQSTISSILTNQTKNINLETIYDICAGLEIELDEFFNCDSLKLINIED